MTAVHVIQRGNVRCQPAVYLTNIFRYLNCLDVFTAIVLCSRNCRNIMDGEINGNKCKK